MGLSRRTFKKEFKLAAVRRLEAGVSMAEVARGLEVSPGVDLPPKNSTSGSWSSLVM
jgi:Transposase